MASLERERVPSPRPIAGREIPLIDRVEEMKLLKEALEHRNENIRITEQAERLLYWNRGISQDAIAGIKYELANLAESPEAKKSRLQEAILDRENSLKLLVKGGPQFGKKSIIYFSPIGSAPSDCG